MRMIIIVANATVIIAGRLIALSSTCRAIIVMATDVDNPKIPAIEGSVLNSKTVFIGCCFYNFSVKLMLK